MPGWQSCRVKANGIEIHYLRTGGPKPPLVLCHGITDNGRCWTRVTEVLEAGYDVIMPDARGHGLSDATIGGYDALTMAADLVGLIGELELDRAILMGHSMGARTVTVAAAEHPEMVRALVLEDPAWWSSQASVGPATESTVDKARMRMAMTHDELLNDQRKRHPTWVDAELLPWAEAKAQLSPNILLATAPPRRDWRADVAVLACPALLVTGDPKLGAVVTSEVAEEALTLSSHVRLANVEGAGHSIHRDQFDAYMKAVQQFLAGL